MPRIEPNDSLSLLLVQQNVDSWAPGRFADALEQAQRLTLDELRRHRGESDASSPRPVDAVVWSETALRRPYRGPDDYYRSLPEVQPFTQFLRTIDRPLITGSALPAGADGRDATNSALVIRPDGRLIGSYAKQQLVPFAESIPFWDVPVVKRFFRNVVGLYGTWIPGDRSNTVSLPLSNGEEVPVGMPICFEDAFGWVPRELVNNGAEVLINLTNNSWSRQDSAQTQHFVAARLRTIELRTPLVRSTNSGLTTVVDAHGVASQSLPMFESASRVVQVPMYSDTWTLYRAWGDWLGIAAVAAALLTVVATAVRSRPELGRRATGGPAGR
jgi:apolipoprotein N-acyltransferase